MHSEDRRVLENDYLREFGRRDRGLAIIVAVSALLLGLVMGGIFGHAMGYLSGCQRAQEMSTEDLEDLLADRYQENRRMKSLIGEHKAIVDAIRRAKGASKGEVK